MGAHGRRAAKDCRGPGTLAGGAVRNGSGRDARLSRFDRADGQRAGAGRTAPARRLSLPARTVAARGRAGGSPAPAGEGGGRGAGSTRRTRSRRASPTRMRPARTPRNVTWPCSAASGPTRRCTGSGPIRPCWRSSKVSSASLRSRIPCSSSVTSSRKARASTSPPASIRTRFISAAQPITRCGSR